jgi:hypothetical protein
MGSEVHVGSPFFPIPYQFYKTWVAHSL